jgi:hypothetical protein
VRVQTAFSRMLRLPGASVLDVSLGAEGVIVTGLRYWEHLGGGGGFFNTMRIYPDLNLGLVAMGNRTSWDYQRLADALTPRKSLRHRSTVEK